MYVVLEIQTNTTGQVGTLVNAYESQNVAYQKYHTVLAAAAVSALPVHTAVLLSDDGFTIARESFSHGHLDLGEEEGE